MGSCLLFYPNYNNPYFLSNIKTYSVNDWLDQEIMVDLWNKEPVVLELSFASNGASFYKSTQVSVYEIACYNPLVGSFSCVLGKTKTKRRKKLIDSEEMLLKVIVFAVLVDRYKKV
jgi:hypothetical protein